MNIKILVKLSSLFITIFLSGCNFINRGGNDINFDVTDVVSIGDVIVDTEVNEFEGLSVNHLTGLLIDEEIAMQRPVAIVINNIPRALPQSGISQADIFYEVLAEGGITRIIGIFRDFDTQKVGPIRSTRDYFVHFALDHNAVLVHHGGSPQGYSEISRLRVNNLDGMVLEGSAFFRDAARRNQPGMFEHSSYTNKENIFTSIENSGFDMYPDTIQDQPFNFYEESTQPKGGIQVDAVTIPFSNSQISTFEYNKKTKEFIRYQNSKAHIDEETNEQLKVKNIIVQKVNENVIAGDTEGRLMVELIGEGEGYLITEGVYVPITWKKSSSESPTQWFDENGNKLELNKGKTWICVFKKSNKVIFENNA